MNKAHSTNGTIRSAEHGRLVYYRRKASANYWDEQWDALINEGYYSSARNGELGQFEAIFTQYLPRNGRILEAGCGTGKWVLALRERGYDAEGVDYASETIEKVVRLIPDLPIRSGDVCALDAKNGQYAAYISIGVVEHRIEGPEPFFEEAYRVLASDGTAIFSVPWYNPLRQFKSRVGCFRGNGGNEESFYQYAFRAAELEQKLSNAGFDIVESLSSSNINMGFEDELPFLEILYKRGRVGRLLKRLIRSNRVIPRYFGHTRIYVCRKP